ncbi:nucleoside deaminase [Halorarius litoreus]|uniref:nucleoside deaminase n=1 Tax=Halorarius litoreus TaxID=2962676 RepID=UPI0020CE9B10|nr:nucleoside deaminase [Halorarius litoreus]
MDLETLDHEPYIERALDLAREAADRGDEPFGSLLVHDGEVVAEARNAVATEGDLREHPELTLATWAARERSAAERGETVMYTSTEPCAMCSGGIYHAGLGAVVYSTSAERVAEFTGRDFAVPSRDVFAYGDREVRVVGPVLPEAGADVHRDYWP